MSIRTFVFEETTAAKLMAAFDAAFAALLNHRILDVDLSWSDSEAQTQQKKLMLLVTTEDIGATITAPYKLMVSQALTIDSAEAVYQAFLTDNPTHFVGAPEYTYGVFAAAPSRYTIAWIYNSDADDGNINWFYGQKGYRTIAYAAAAQPTTGTWDQGDRRYEDDAAAGGTVGEVITTPGTYGTLAAVTGDITNLDNELTVNDVSDLRPGMYIEIAGVTGSFKILSITGLVVTLSGNADATVSGAAVTYTAPVWKAFGTIAA